MPVKMEFFMKMLEAEIETRKLPVFISEADLRLRRRLQARLHVLRNMKPCSEMLLEVTVY